MITVVIIGQYGRRSTDRRADAVTTRSYREDQLQSRGLARAGLVSAKPTALGMCNPATHGDERRHLASKPRIGSLNGQMPKIDTDWNPGHSQL
ncbi:hypothetical protein DSM43276_02939 [Mycobacteroides salmoniphilum]|nr:hypothetical protein DSM43276_02939 [Mycobacteroides salmoniphilum]